MPTQNQMRDQLIALLGPDAHIIGPEKIDQLASFYEETYARGQRDMKHQYHRQGPATVPGLTQRGNKGRNLDKAALDRAADTASPNVKVGFKPHNVTIESTLEGRIDKQFEAMTMLGRYVDSHAKTLVAHAQRLDRLENWLYRLLDAITAVGDCTDELSREMMNGKRPGAERNAPGRSEDTSQAATETP